MKQIVEFEFVLDWVVVPIRVHTVLISTQHDETATNDKIAVDLKEHVIKPVIPTQYLDEKTIFHLNPSGRFVIGGPQGDASLTGRKIIIDTEGGWGPWRRRFLRRNFDFRPGMITINLDLKRRGGGRFLKMAAYRHFGRDDADLTWETVKPLKCEKLA